MYKAKITLALLSTLSISAFCGPVSTLTCDGKPVGVNSTVKEVTNACGAASEKEVRYKQGKVLSTKLIYKNIPLIVTFKFMGSNTNAKIKSFDVVRFR